MATIEQFQERVRRAVHEALQKVLIEGELPEAERGEARFTTIERLALAAGDAVSLEVFEQQLAESGMGPPHCPRCGFEGKRIKQRDRTVQTRRGLAVPLSRYRPSPVAFPERLPEPEYYETDQVRRVYKHGGVSLNGRRIKLSSALRGLDVAFRATPVDGVLDVFFMRFQIAQVDLRDPNAHGASVRNVSEHLSGRSPV